MRQLAHLVAVALVVVMAGTASAQMPQELYKSGYAEQVSEQAQMLISAYQLDESLQGELIGELYARGEAAAEYDKQMHQELMAIANSGDESLLLERMAEFVEAAPLNDDRLAEWVEQRVPADVAARGRPRFEELKERRTKIAEAREEDVSQRSGAKANRVQARVNRNAPVDDRMGTPMPRGRKGEQIARKMEDRRSRVASEIQRPNAPAPKPQPTREARPKIDRSQPQPKADKLPDAPYAKAPPLDEWDKHVAAIAEKYAFTDAQVTKAQSILRDLRRRAYQYRTSHAQDYERAEKIEDRAKREAQIKYLDKAIDAMFDELKQRLESLPTIEQRQKAESKRG